MICHLSLCCTAETADNNLIVIVITGKLSVLHIAIT